ncbi:hypothetical protein Cma02nite_24330 [Cellulomonas marina]|uniref:Uncharacterized protein n=2 Tax=Cellulomonas marina TaxID=988821 RepID=A0A1I0XIR0_9CELL|nr:hypothetical protein Cma02nite_24330 [Cellulomonas marina]SFB00200.1 hypothetical protein SAMN05421867_10546 [Cellulomonas marina]
MTVGRRAGARTPPSGAARPAPVVPGRGPGQGLPGGTFRATVGRMATHGGPEDDGDLTALRERAEAGDRDAVDQLVELAGERRDLVELRRLADAGSRAALDELVQVAAEEEDLDTLRALAEAGHRDAVDVLEELEGGRPT